MVARLTPVMALERAVAIIGSQSATARLCGVRQPTVFKWLSKRKPLPAEHVLKVEAATGIPKEDLRPDIYPRAAGDIPPGGAGTGAGGESSSARADLPEPLSGLSA